MGLQDVPFIQTIIVDPKNPDVAVVGGNSIGFGIVWRPLPETAKTANRGIFRTVDGGKVWTEVFSAEDSIGVVDLCIRERATYVRMFSQPPGLNCQIRWVFAHF